MAIICSDLHCNWEKVERFLNYKPEEVHIFAGDILDSYTYSFESAIKSLNLLLDSNCILIWGNHDIGYSDLSNKPFTCSGFQYSDAPIFESVLKPNKNRFKFAYAVDDYLITHAGVADFLAKEDDVYNEAEYLNSEPQGIYAIGRIRGGYQKTGGPLWFDFRHEEGLSYKYNQVFGHCCLSRPWDSRDIYRGDFEKEHHCICINTYEDAPELYCFNTTTKQIEEII